MIANEGGAGLPANAAALLAERVDFVMLGQLEAHLAAGAPLALAIVDEAHHAAAPSYQPLFTSNPALRGLFLTATPNRTDGLPLGIDEVGFSITYRDLFERGVILMPTFEPFEVQNFEWSNDDLKELATEVLTRAEKDFVKTIVVAPTIDKVQRFHSALVDALTKMPGHVLTVDDIGFVHSKGAPGDAAPEDYIQEFVAKPRGILISAQMLIEGFDDPSVNAVVVTYPTSSLVLLMQAAGRCVRYAPGKKRAFVLQAHNDDLAYRYDQRWLYLEISDLLRPRLEDYYYSDIAQLRERVMQVVDGAHIGGTARTRIEQQLAEVAAGDRCRLLLFGLPYDRSRGPFATSTSWKGLLETSANTDLFRKVFNDYCALDAAISDPSPFLQQYIGYSPLPDGEYRLFYTMLLSMYYAHKEVTGDHDVPGDERPYKPGNATTWITYVTFHHEPSVPATVRTFFQACVNGTELLTEYSKPGADWFLCVRVPLPLGGVYGWLLHQSDAAWLVDKRRTLVTEMSGLTPKNQLVHAITWTVNETSIPVPAVLAAHLHRVIVEDAWNTNTLTLVTSTEQIATRVASQTTVNT